MNKTTIAAELRPLLEKEWRKSPLALCGGGVAQSAGVVSFLASK